MDLSTVFQCLIDQMDPEDMLHTANEVLSEMLGPKPPSAVPAGENYEFDTTTQPVEDFNGVYDAYLPLEAAPLGFQHPTAAATLNVELPAPSSYYLNPVSDDLYSQGQYFPYQWPEYDASTAAIGALPHLNLPVEMPQGLEQNLEPVVLLGMVYGNPGVTSFPPIGPASPQFSSPPQKRERNYHQYKRQPCAKNKQPYVKKPPNAFMLFLKEQRPNVTRDLECRDNALVNKVLGQRWKAMSNRQQAKYFKEAEGLRKLHAEKYPWWSPRDNYGQKRKRIRRRCPTMSNDDDEDWEP
ncbi:transcription factor 7-like [Solea solea]|uniref:transcription factor 7-like n=1 Tax=Solea solea TaxID=90069 RepID=UPI00272A0B47|nr:transcription factor 7-like [Solea solea]XP_058498058.1 transcription factor 7-like [Solea solea]